MSSQRQNAAGGGEGPPLNHKESRDSDQLLFAADDDNGIASNSLRRSNAPGVATSSASVLTTQPSSSSVAAVPSKQTSPPSGIKSGILKQQQQQTQTSPILAVPKVDRQSSTEKLKDRALRTFSLPEQADRIRFASNAPRPTAPPPNREEDDDSDGSSAAPLSDTDPSDFEIEDDTAKSSRTELAAKRRRARRRRKQEQQMLRGGDELCVEVEEDDNGVGIRRRNTTSGGRGMSKSLNMSLGKSFDFQAAMRAARRNTVLATARQISRAQMRGVATMAAATTSIALRPHEADLLGVPGSVPPAPSSTPGSHYGSSYGATASGADALLASSFPGSVASAGVGPSHVDEEAMGGEFGGVPPTAPQAVTPASALVEMGESGKMHVEEAEGSSTMQSIFNTVNLLLGLGLLSLPYALRCGGWIPGFAILAFTALTTSYTAYTLSRCLSLHPGQLHDFADIGEAAFGPRARLLVSFLFISELFFTCVAFVILVSDSLHALMPDLPFWMCHVMAFAACTMSTFARKLKYISYASLLGIAASFYLVVVVVWDGWTKKTKPGSLWEWEDTFAWPEKAVSVSLTFGIVMAGFAGHAVLPNIYLDMRDKSKFPLVLGVSFTTALSLYALVAGCGYLMFGELTLEEITKNLAAPGASVNPWMNRVATGLIAFIPIPKFALTMAPVALALDQFTGLQLHRRGLLALQNTASAAFADPHGGHGAPQHTHTGGTRLALTPPRPIQLLLRTLLGGLAALVPLLVPHFDVVLSLLGCIFSTAVSVVLPVACYLRMFPVKPAKGKQVAEKTQEEEEEEALLREHEALLGARPPTRPARPTMGVSEAVACWVLLVFGTLGGAIATFGSLWPGARPI
ncbi:hypothetical protein HDU96_006995 [Phlyctochytrium bullatum]|nr:hypothetical protein HDU96_006995 [Phlyctochytrium bullatum]